METQEMWVEATLNAILNAALNTIAAQNIVSYCCETVKPARNCEQAELLNSKWLARRAVVTVNKCIIT